MLGRQDDERLARAEAAQARHRVGEGHHDGLRRLAVVAQHVVRPLGGEHGDGTGLTRQPARDVQRLPRALLLQLGDAERVLAGMPLRGAIEQARQGPQAVERDEADGAPQRGVRAPAGSEHVAAGVEAEARSDRTVDDEQRRRAAGAGDRAVQREGGIGHRLQRGQQHRHVLGPAAGHHGVDRDLLGRDRAPARRLAQHDVVRPAPGGLEKPAHRLRGRRHHGEPVRPAALEVRLDRLRPAGHFVLFRGERHVRLLAREDTATRGCAERSGGAAGRTIEEAMAAGAALVGALARQQMLEPAAGRALDVGAAARRAPVRRPSARKRLTRHRHAHGADDAAGVVASPYGKSFSPQAPARRATTGPNASMTGSITT